jgi:hypothetical protein
MKTTQLLYIYSQNGYRLQCRRRISDVYSQIRYRLQCRQRSSYVYSQIRCSLQWRQRNSYVYSQIEYSLQSRQLNSCICSQSGVHNQIRQFAMQTTYFLLIQAEQIYCAMQTNAAPVCIIRVDTFLKEILGLVPQIDSQKQKQTNELHGLNPRANYTDRATAASQRSDCQLLRIKCATWSAWRIPTAVFSVF